MEIIATASVYSISNIHLAADLELERNIRVDSTNCLALLEFTEAYYSATRTYDRLLKIVFEKLNTKEIIKQEKF
jgi:hypothetical protein